MLTIVTQRGCRSFVGNCAWLEIMIGNSCTVNRAFLGFSITAAFLSFHTKRPCMTDSGVLEFPIMHSFQQKIYTPSALLWWAFDATNNFPSFLSVLLFHDLQLGIIPPVQSLIESALCFSFVLFIPQHYCMSLLQRTIYGERKEYRMSQYYIDLLHNILGERRCRCIRQNKSYDGRNTYIDTPYTPEQL